METNSCILIAFHKWHKQLNYLLCEERYQNTKTVQSKRENQCVGLKKIDRCLNLVPKRLIKLQNLVLKDTITINSVLL